MSSGHGCGEHDDDDALSEAPRRWASANAVGVLRVRETLSSQHRWLGAAGNTHGHAMPNVDRVYGWDPYGSSSKWGGQEDVPFAVSTRIVASPRPGQTPSALT